MKIDSRACPGACAHAYIYYRAHACTHARVCPVFGVASVPSGFLDGIFGVKSWFTLNLRGFTAGTRNATGAERSGTAYFVESLIAAWKRGFCRNGEIFGFGAGGADWNGLAQKNRHRWGCLFSFWV